MKKLAFIAVGVLLLFLGVKKTLMMKSHQQQQQKMEKP